MKHLDRVEILVEKKNTLMRVFTKACADGYATMKK